MEPLKSREFDFGWQNLLESRLYRTVRQWRKTTKRAGTFIKWRVFAPVATALYRFVTHHLSWWPLDWVERRPRWCTVGQRRVVYYLWSFPTLTQTFIQRELAALMKTGISVEVVAHRFEDWEFLDRDARLLTEHTHYLVPIGRAELARYAWGLFLRRPLTLINAFLYILLSKYDGRKSIALDLAVFARVVYLATVLKKKGAHHVHSPWASVDAFVALVAARLLKIPYTVQVRAYDLHRQSSAVGLSLKLANADFIVTNSRYNESVIRMLLPSGSEGKIRTIYNGIDLSRFQAPDQMQWDGASVKILSVAELVEPKGLEYLIRACKILRDRGHIVKCEIIGARVISEINYYIELKKLRKALALETEVAFLGRQPFERVLEKYGEVDMFVFPAVTARHGGRDITPNALIEAMAMKLPVVSTNSGAIPEVIEDGVSGILVPPRNEAALAGAMIRLLTNDSLRTELGNNARKRVEERFDVNKNIAEFVKVFTRGAKCQKAPACVPASNLHKVFHTLNRIRRLPNIFRPAGKQVYSATASTAKDEWRISLFPDGHSFAFTIVHDADSAYSRRLSPLFDVFDEFGFKITVTAFVFWADWAKNGDIWLEWNKTAFDDDKFIAPKAVPLVDEEECKFYKHLAARGHEMGMHTPSDTSNTRQDVIRAFEYFAEIFGYYPKTYIEHSASSNKEAQANEGSNRGSMYYNTDLLNHYGPWVWIDDSWGVPHNRHPQFYDILAVNDSPFNNLAAQQYGINKGFLRTGKWKEGDGDGFLAWYSEANIDALEANRGIALVYTHLDSKWLDTETRKMRAPIKDRLRYLASKNGWFVGAGRILDRVQASSKIKVYYDDEILKIDNTGRERLEGLTVISKKGRSLSRIHETLRPGRQGEIVLGTIHPGESLWFKIVQP